MTTFVFRLALQIEHPNGSICSCWSDRKERRTLIKHLGCHKFVSDLESGNPKCSHELQIWQGSQIVCGRISFCDGRLDRWLCVTSSSVFSHLHVCICKNAHIHKGCQRDKSMQQNSPVLHESSDLNRAPG